MIKQLFLWLLNFEKLLFWPSHMELPFKFSDDRVSDLPHSKLTNSNIIVSYGFIQMFFNTF